MTKEEILDKIKKQHGYIDAIDAYILTSVYIDEYSDYFQAIGDIETQLIYMYNVLLTGKQKKTKKIIPNHIIPDNYICIKCHINKDIIKFDRNNLKKLGHDEICKDCKYLTTPKTCKVCKVEKDRSEFGKKVECADGLLIYCKECQKEMNKNYHKKYSNK
jgi:hypothetical protein